MNRYLVEAYAYAMNKRKEELEKVFRDYVRNELKRIKNHINKNKDERVKK